MTPPDRYRSSISTGNVKHAYPLETGSKFFRIILQAVGKLHMFCKCSSIDVLQIENGNMMACTWHFV